MQAYRRALANNANYPGLRNNLAATIRLSGGDLNESFALLSDAVAHNPNDVDAWTNLAVARRERLDLDGALAAGARVVELAPLNAAAANNHSLTLKAAQQWKEAERYAEAACHLDPGNAMHRTNLGLLYLLQGRYAQGWPNFEARWQSASELRGMRSMFPMPQWKGEPLKEGLHNGSHAT